MRDYNCTMWYSVMVKITFTYIVYCSAAKLQMKNSDKCDIS